MQFCLADFQNINKIDYVWRFSRKNVLIAIHVTLQLTYSYIKASIYKPEKTKYVLKNNDFD